MTEQIKKDFLGILAEELIPAMGCTEPIALAFAAAKGAFVLGEEPTRIRARCSGNIIKNVRCVRIPNSGGMTGIEAASALGALAGDSERHMEVLESVTCAGLEKTVKFLSEGRCSVEFLESRSPLHFIIELYGEENTAEIEIRHSHTNIVRITKNGSDIFKTEETVDTTEKADRSALNIENIVQFCDEIGIDKISSFAEKQVECNMAIAERGMQGDLGVGIGKAIFETYADSVFTKMRAYSAAASEARMEG